MRKKKTNNIRVTGEKLEMRNMESIKPYERNARIHGPEQIEQIRKSLREFGFVSPVLIDSEGNLIAGHGRVEAAKLEGMSEVPCVIVDGLTDAQRRAYILADNRLAETSTWDEALLKIELGELGEIGLDFDAIGFDLGDIGGAELDDEAETEPEAQEDDYDGSVPETTKVKRGDVYALGRHRLMCGDATSSGDVQVLMRGGQADLLLTDPPYGVDYTGKTADALKIDNDKKSDDEFAAFLEKSFSNAMDAIKAGAAFYIWHADTKSHLFRNACVKAGFEVRQCLVWVKNTLVLGRQDYQWKHEPCLYGWKGGAGHQWYADRKQTTVLEFDRPTRSAEHPTMKPIALFDYQIKNSSKKNDIVLDLFAGSGTTVLACQQNGRTAYCMELAPKYCQVIIDRWEALTGEKAVFADE